jgi:hypothetical protein
MMSDMTHRPTPEFSAYLESEVTAAFRRERRLAERPRRRHVGWLRAAAVVLVSIALGTSAGLASAQIRDSARRDSLLEAAKAEAELAALRLGLARERMSDATRKLQVGAVGPSSVASAESELRLMEAQAMRARYNIEEITASAQPPRDDLNAPLVAGRDFVKDRLQLDLMATQQRLSAAEAAAVEAERRVRVGAAPAIVRLEAEAELTRARAAMAVLAERQKLRREFLEKRTPGDQLIRRLEESQLRQDAFVAQQMIVILREQLAELEKRRAAGAVEDLEVLQAKVNLQVRELEAQQVMRRLRALGRTPRDSMP